MRAAPGADDDVTAWLIKHGYSGADIVAALRENLVETFVDLAFLAPLPQLVLKNICQDL